MAQGTKRRGARDYCYLRGNVYQFLYRYPADLGGERIEHSLGTSDREIARAQAALMAAQHKIHVKQMRILRRAKITETPSLTEDEVGTFDLPGGGKKIVTKSHIVYINADGHASISDNAVVEGSYSRQTKIRPEDREEYEQLIRIQNQIYDIDIDTPDMYLARSCNQEAGARFRQKDESDAEMLQFYFRKQNTSLKRRQTYEKVLEDFNRLTGKTLRTAQWTDGEALAQYYDTRTNKRREADGKTPKPIASATTQNKLGCLRSLWNKCHRKFDLKGENPFSQVCELRDDAERREPLTEAEVAKVEANLSRFRPHVQLAWKLLLHTGGRTSEFVRLRADSEFIEDGIRCIHIAKPSRRAKANVLRGRGKTGQSERRIPLPDAVTSFQFMPAKIEGPLFGDRSADDLSNDLNDMLKALKIATRENGKVVYELRHRAKDRLRAARIGTEEQDAILGHNKRTVADSYGKGFPMELLHKWMAPIDPQYARTRDQLAEPA